MSLENNISLPDVMKATGLGKSTIYRLMSKNRFPKPIKIGARTVAWRESDIKGYLDSQATSETHKKDSLCPIIHEMEKNMFDIYKKRCYRDGKSLIAVICDDAQSDWMMSEIMSIHSSMGSYCKKEKPADAPTSTGFDSSIVSPKSDKKEESASDSTLTISQQAIAKIKRVSESDSERGKVIRRLIDGEIVTSQEYPHITTLWCKLGKLLGKGVVGKTKVARRRKNGKVQTYVGYFFRVIPTIK